MDLSKKVGLERAMNMSLDEYIRESGLYVSPMLLQHRSQQNLKTFNEDVDLDREDVKVEITSDSEETFDLRNKLSIKDTSVTGPNTTPKVDSQQWRLLHPNNQQNRPAGMPPLVTNERSVENIVSMIQKHKSNWSNNKNRRKRNRNQSNNINKNNSRQQQQQNNKQSDQGQRQPQQRQNYQQQQTYNNRQNFNRVASGRVDRRNNKDIWAGARTNQNNRRNNCPNGNSALDLRIETLASNESTPNVQKLPQTHQQLTSFGNVLPVASGQNSVMGSMTTLHSSNILDAFGGIKLELMPMIAGKLLEALQGPNKIALPKYDMKIQKEIHSIQNKPMVYKCPGGEVISSDGAGLNCKMTPASTGISLNQRFA